MNKWIDKQNAYSVFRQLVMIAMLYDLVAAMIFSLGGYANMGGFFSGTVSFYIGAIIVARTPKGKKYFTPLFNIAVYILLVSRLFNSIGVMLSIPIREKYSVIFVFSMTAFIFMILGMYLGNKTSKDKDNDRRED